MSRDFYGIYSSFSGEWETPAYIFDPLNKEFNFTIDVAATEQNKKCERFYTINNTGLTKSWSNESVWCNPPYGRDVEIWIKKCHDEVKYGNAKVVVALLPARTDTKFFHSYIYNKAEIRFIEGRVKFINGGKYGAPFPSMIVIWSKQC